MSDETKPIHPVLETVKGLLPGLAKVFGENAEIVLHELSHPEDSAVAIEGNITGRKPGAPLTDLILTLLRQGRLENDLVNYPIQTPDGKTLRSSTIFIRDENKNVVGCLCINIDISKWIVAKHLVEQYCHAEPVNADGGETFNQDVEGMLAVAIDDEIEREGMPVALIKKEAKIKIVERLDARGVFLIKGAVEAVAKSLDVSRYTVYNYLDETRGSRSSPG